MKTENVWDYPRPPRLEPVSERLRVMSGDLEIANTTRGFRVLETSHPPVYYIPRGDIADGAIEAVGGTSYCEWKGMASYFDVITPRGRLPRIAWAYPDPTATFAPIAGHLAFYATDLECYVGDEQVTPQPGGFYGGWVTSNLVGPFKGGPGSMGW